MKELLSIIFSLLFIILIQTAITGKAFAQDDSDHTKIVQIDNGSNHIYVLNSADEHVVKIDAGNDNHICVVHDADGKIVEVENRTSHILINTHGTGEDSDDCNSVDTDSTPTLTPTPEPSQTPDPTAMPTVSPTPNPTATPTPTPSATNDPTPTPSSVVVTASTDGSSNDQNILAASTMAPTGNAWINIGHILEVLGLSLAALGALIFIKSKKLFSK